MSKEGFIEKSGRWGRYPDLAGTQRVAATASGSDLAGRLQDLTHRKANQALLNCSMKGPPNYPQRKGSTCGPNPIS
jgi:hypothetical protein